MDEHSDFDQSNITRPPRVEEIVSWVERVTRRSLGDVRIHDSAQAGALTRRLGARAFAAGRDIYVRPELLRPLTRENAALLAHELYHVAEQSGEVAAPELQADTSMPLLRPSPSYTRSHFGYSAPQHPTGALQPSPPSMVASTPGGPMAVQRQTAQGVPLQRALGATSGGLSGSEAAAEAVAGAVTQQTRDRESKQAAPPPDPEAIADLVYRQIAYELLLDRERGIL